MLVLGAPAASSVPSLTPYITFEGKLGQIYEASDINGAIFQYRQVAPTGHFSGSISGSVPIAGNFEISLPTADTAFGVSIFNTSIRLVIQDADQGCSTPQARSSSTPRRVIWRHFAFKVRQRS